MPRSIEALSPSTQRESTETQTDVLEKRIDLSYRDPRAINKLVKRWPGAVKRFYFDDNSRLIEDPTQAVLSQLELYQGDQRVALIKKQSQDRSASHLTLFASSKERLDLLTLSINELLDSYEQEFQAESSPPETSVEKEQHPDKFWQVRMYWIIKQATKPDRYSSQIPKKFWYIEPKIQ